MPRPREEQEKLYPPETRVSQAWARVWRGMYKDSWRKLQRAYDYAEHIRRIR